MRSRFSTSFCLSGLLIGVVAIGLVHFHNSFANFNNATAQNFRSQAAAMAQRLQHRFACKVLEMGARFAQPQAPKPDFAELELTPYEVVQGHATGKNI